MGSSIPGQISSEDKNKSDIRIIILEQIDNTYMSLISSRHS